MLIKKVAIITAILILSLAILFAGVMTFYNYTRKPIEEYCASLKKSQSLSEVVAMAKSKGFVVLDNTIDSGYVTILNHRAFAFRYGCTIETDGIRANGAQFRGAD